jgi:DNA-binding PadR family transcriptional regulator
MLDLLILRTLQVESRHGWDIAERIKQSSNEVLYVQQGSLRLLRELHEWERLSGAIALVLRRA